MKLFFTKSDTLYKIMKSLEKVPKGKHLFLYIDHENSFFSHPRWGKQIDSLLKEKLVDYVCVCKDSKTKTFFENLGMSYQYDAPNRLLQALHLVGMFLFNFKKFHLSVFTKKNSISYVFIIGEILLIAAIIYVMYQFLVPSTKILIQPAYTVEDIVYNFRYYQENTQSWNELENWNYISVPYQYGSMEYSQTLSVPIYSLQYLGKPSSGKITVANTLSTKYTLKIGTRFITDDKLIFTADSSFVLPPWSRTNPSLTTITVTAADKDENGAIIGNKWNIGSWTRLLIRNLQQSYVLGSIYATTTTDFSGWYVNTWSTISDKDILLIKEKLLAAVSWDNKKVIVKKQFNNENQFLLPLDNLITVQDVKYTINWESGDTLDVLEWKIDVVYRYPYIIWNNLLDSIMHYLDQRPSQTRQLISLQKNTTIFYDATTVENLIIIPTKVSAVWGYDFQQDTNHLLSEITDKIAWKSRDVAKNILLSYPEISAVILKLSPVWSDVLPTLKSRITYSTTSPTQ